MFYLTEENFLSFAVKYYTVPHFIEQEFYSDLKRIKYIKRLFHKYEKTGEVKERLLLNHMILIYNVFEKDPCTHMLFFKVNSKHHSILKTILDYLNYIPKDYESDVEIDIKLRDKLNALKKIK